MGVDDYWEQGYGRIIMVPRVKLAYDKVSPSRLLVIACVTAGAVAVSEHWADPPIQKVYDIIHPERRNLTAIRGYKRIGGLPDDPRTDPQDRSWYGPHDRLFTEEEEQEMTFQHGPKHGTSMRHDGPTGPECPQLPSAENRANPLPNSVVLGMGRCGRSGRTRR